MRTDRSIKLASIEKTLSLSGGALELADAGEGKLPTFSMVAYTGGAMHASLYGFPTVVDLDGLQITAKARPILKDHDRRSVVGHTTSAKKIDGQLEVKGTISGETDAAREVVGSAKNGFPWQASIGASVLREEFVKAGISVRVNGKSFKGPLYVVRQSRLKEVSFLPLGADDDTSTSIAAQHAGDQTMDPKFRAYLEANDFDHDKLSEGQLKSLKAAYEAQKGGDTPPPKKAPKQTSADAGDVELALEEMRETQAAEQRRVAAIEAAAKGDRELIAKAIEENLDATWVELQVMKSERSFSAGAPSAGSSSGGLTEKIIEAGLAASLGMPEEDRLANYGEKILNQAESFEGIGLQETFLLAAQMEKTYTGQVFGNGDKVFEAAYTTGSIPNILENILGKLALKAFEAEEIYAMQLCKISTVKDFKRVTRVRLLGMGKWEQVGPGGELKHGVMSDEKFENQADTYGQINAIDRTTVINDDLQFLADLGQMMGDDGREVINDLYFMKLATTAGFFSAGNKNLREGVDTAFGPDSLKAAKAAFRKHKSGGGKKDKDKRAIGVNPKILIVPSELETDADILVGSNRLNVGGGNADNLVPDKNPHAGKFRVVSPSHLSDENYFATGGDTAWYLAAEPSRLAHAELVFLNGRKRPHIERVPLPGNILGRGFRGIIDVGCELQDPRAILKNTGVVAA